MGYKLDKFCENRTRDMPLRGVNIPHFGQIGVKISDFGVLHPCRCTDGGETWHLLCAKFHPIGAMCRPCGAKNLKIGL